MQSVRGGDLVSGLALAALGAFVVVHAFGWEYLTADGPGPGFFPRWYGIAMIVLSLALVVRSLRNAGGAVAKPSDASYARPLVCWAALVGCILLSTVLGFFVSFTLLAWVMGTLLFAQPQRTILPFALGSAIVFWLVFDVALGVALPRGPWGA